MSRAPGKTSKERSGSRGPSKPPALPSSSDASRRTLTGGLPSGSVAPPKEFLREARPRKAKAAHRRSHGVPKATEFEREEEYERQPKRKPEETRRPHPRRKNEHEAADAFPRRPHPSALDGKELEVLGEEDPAQVDGKEKRTKEEEGEEVPEVRVRGEGIGAAQEEAHGGFEDPCRPEEQEHGHPSHLPLLLPFCFVPFLSMQRSEAHMYARTPARPRTSDWGMGCVAFPSRS